VGFGGLAAMNGTYLRRAFTCSLVLLCASNLPSCATPDIICNMKIDYAGDTQHGDVAPQGNVRLAWRFNAEQRNGSYGNADCTRGDDPLCIVRLKDAPPKFSDVCGLARLGHEVAHAMEVNR
jgi:hypothetical protein